MDKQSLVRLVLDEIRSRIEGSRHQLAEILRRANDAPGAMQSHSDTDKNLYGRQAAGQKESIETMEQEYTSTQMLALGQNTEVTLGSLVVVEDEQGTHRYFLLPGGGAITVECSEGPVTVITPHTPLGSMFLGRKSGETIIVGKRTLTIVDVL